MPTLGRFRYLEAASGGGRPRGTLVLLHAFPLNARMWAPQMELAADGWRVLAPHFRGFDGAIDDPPALTVDDYAGDVVDLLDALHVNDAVIGGLSMGGYVAFALMRLAPDYVRALILADTRPQADSAEAAAGRQRLLETLDTKGAAAVADAMIPKLLGGSTLARTESTAVQVRELILSNPAAAIAGGIRALMSRPDSTPLLRSIRCPALIVVGEEDVLTPPAVSEEMQRAIAGSERVVIPGAGHLSSLEQPGRFNAALAAFLTHRV